MRQILKLSALLAVTTGIILILGGTWGILFTYENIVKENIITPEDASIPNTKVKGPLTLKSQVEIMRLHTLKMTDEKTYAQMPRQIPSVDENGNAVLDNKGKPVMINNSARDIWVTVTALTTALNMAILSYAFSAFTILIGGISVWTGIIFFFLSKKQALHK